MKFAINANVTFGSGDARASLKIDTKKISPTEATSREKKGCVQYHYLDLPLEEVRKIKKIEYISEAWPGGRTEFTGSGRGVYRDWETDRKSTRLNSSHSAKSRMPSSA